MNVLEGERCWHAVNEEEIRTLLAHDVNRAVGILFARTACRARPAEATQRHMRPFRVAEFVQTLCMKR